METRSGRNEDDRRQVVNPLPHSSLVPVYVVDLFGLLSNKGWLVFICTKSAHSPSKMKVSNAISALIPLELLLSLALEALFSASLAHTQK